MKSICFVTTVAMTIEAFLLDFSKYLINNEDYEVTFICNNSESIAKYCSDRIRYIPIRMKRGFNLDALRVIRELMGIFKRERFDIVQYSTPNASLYASIAAKRAGIKNRLYCQWGIRYMGFDGGIKRAFFKWIEKRVCANSTTIESESVSLFNFGIAEGLYSGEKASVIGAGSACGVDLTKYDLEKKEAYRREIRGKHNIPQEAFVFGFTGRLTKDKGINELIGAFKQIPFKENTFLLLVGIFDDEETLDPMLIQWAKEDEHVIFTGQVNQVEQYYCALDVFVSLSYREGFGLVVIEAASMGVPAIVTDVPGQRDTIIPGETGILVPVKNLNKVSEACNYCLENPGALNKMGLAARLNVEKNYEQLRLFTKLAKHRNDMIAAY